MCYGTPFELTVSFLVLNTGMATVVIRTGLWPSSSWVSHKRRTMKESNWEGEEEKGRRGGEREANDET